MKKLFVALLAVLLLVGCTPKEDDHKKFDVLHLYLYLSLSIYKYMYICIYMYIYVYIYIYTYK